MTTEEKAKAYDEALERAKVYTEHSTSTAPETSAINNALYSVFPELAESEDERIRKELIEHIKDQINSFISAPDCRDEYEEEELKRYNSWLSYLKKQKEQKPVDLHDKIEELCSKYPINKYSASDEELSTYHQGVHLGATKIVEYLSEQKPGEKSEIPTNVDLEKEIIEYTDKISPKELNDLPYTHLDECARYFYKLGCDSSKKPNDQWSEEDERIRNAILGFLNPDKGGTKYSSNAELVEWSNWLKSLRPQYHGDVTMTEVYKMGLEAGKALSWKPSEEQIHAIIEALKYLPNNKDEWRILDTLVDVFKKLI